MGKRGRKTLPNGRSAGEGRHVRLYQWMTSTPAYRSLSCHARALLVELYGLYNGENNGQLFLSVRDAGEKTNTNKNTAQRAFRELEERGFVRAKERGSFGHKAGPATTWILTEFGYNNQAATKDFTSWKPPEKQNMVPVEGPHGPARGTAPHLRRVK